MEAVGESRQVAGERQLGSPLPGGAFSKLLTWSLCAGLGLCSHTAVLRPTEHMLPGVCVVRGVPFVVKEHNEINFPLGIAEATSLDLLTKGSDSER